MNYYYYMTNQLTNTSNSFLSIFVLQLQLSNFCRGTNIWKPLNYKSVIVIITFIYRRRTHIQKEYKGELELVVTFATFVVFHVSLVFYVDKLLCYTQFDLKFTPKNNRANFPEKMLTLGVSKISFT